MILHVDMDAFFASIEQAINPRLKGRPLIVGSRENRLYTVVCAASYEAKALGIASGMSTKEAFEICPVLQFVPAQQGKYIWTSEQIFALLKGYGWPAVYVSIDEFQLDIGKLDRPATLAQDIQKRICEVFHITASVGIAQNCLLAKLASKLNKPNGVTVINPENIEETLAKIAVRKLCGVGQSTELFFQVLGIETCLDLYQKNARFLEVNLGKVGLNLFAGLHMVEHFQELDDNSPPKSMGHSYTFPRACQNPGFIRGWLRLLSEMVSRRLREDNLVSNIVHLWLNGPEIANLGCQKSFQQATNDGYEIYARCRKIMAQKAPKMPKIRAIGVTCSGLSVNHYSASLLKEESSREDLLQALDRINNRFGEDTVYPAIVALARKMP